MTTNQQDPFAQSIASDVMELNGLMCTLNMPPALRSRIVNGEEVAQPLPPYNTRPAFKVDDFEACPTHWMRGGPNEASYFVPVMANRGMWLDFNRNHRHPYHVAVVISIQGVNSISGLEMTDPFLEQYREKCPEHGQAFGADRECSACGWLWPPQNYLAGNAIPRGRFWLDGFRSEDGVTRQYLLTEDDTRGIAAQVIGERRVFAIGIAFFLSKEPKPQPAHQEYSFRSPGGVLHHSPLKGIHHAGLGALEATDEPVVAMFSPCEALFTMEAEAPMEVADSETFIEEEILEIGAGARIDQPIQPDPEALDFWQEKPAGLLYINYVGVKTCEAILAKGMRDRTAGGEGWMQGLKVGNPSE